MSALLTSPAPSVGDGTSSEHQTYRMYGLTVRSAFALPVPPAGVDGAPDVTIIRGESPCPGPDGELVVSEPCSVHGVDALVHRGPNGSWIWNVEVGTCHISPNASSVVVYPEAGVDPRQLGLVLAGAITVFVLHQRGRATLHASAVATEYGAVAFLGTNGQGKTSLAGNFLQRGAALLTDDVLPLQVDADAIRGMPSMPYMKVWPQTVERVFSVDRNLPSLFGDHEKRLMLLDGALRFAAAPSPIAAFFVLHRYDPDITGHSEVRSELLTARQGVAVLLAQVSRGAYQLPAEAARFLPLYARLVKQAPVRSLYYPNGFEHQDAVYARILADVSTTAVAGVQAR